MTKPGHNDTIEDLRKEWTAYSAFLFREMVTGNKDHFLPKWREFIEEDLKRIAR